jgi:hypothetical protein
MLSVLRIATHFANTEPYFVIGDEMAARHDL